MIDPQTQAELRARFNPDGSQLRKLQMRMLEMLKFIDKVCRENDIKYWLSSGTCLGAVRHGGFIPWDDDVDIEMLEPDYRRLREVLTSLPADSQYVWQDASADPGYVFTYAKLRDKKSEIVENNKVNKEYKYKGIFIDIFYLRPSNLRFIEYLTNRYRAYAVVAMAGINSFITRKVIFPASRWVLNNILTPVVSKISAIGAGNRLRHSVGAGFLAPRDSRDFERVIRVPFEDCELPIPENYESYLSMYGDYNALPLLDSIQTHTSEIKFL